MTLPYSEFTMGDDADAAQAMVECAERYAIRRPSGSAPCGCAVVTDDDGRTVAECELADAAGEERPEHCRRKRTRPRAR